MMGFNKDKVLKKAEALAGKGRIDGAIKEFKKIVAKEGDDENILNRIGDLYKRLRKTEEAMTYWGKTADLYEHKGFYLKAIAVQKKIQRCDPGSLTSHRRLAELYHRQGLHNDARVHYQHLVDHYLRTNEGASAIGIYQKLIELEPENPTHRAKLAELYRQQQLTSKAMDEYVEIARLMLTHNEMDQALQVYSKALQIDPTDMPFLRNAVDAFDRAGSRELAEELLNKAVELNPDAERLRAELLAGESPQSQGDRSFDPIPGANTGGFELIDTDQADAVDSGMQVIHSGSPTLDPGFEPPIHESVTPSEQPPIAPPSLTPPPAAQSLPAEASSTQADSAGLEEFVIEFEEGPPDSMVSPPADLVESETPGDALSSDFDIGVEITLDGLEAMAPEASSVEDEVLLADQSAAGFELAPFEAEAAPPVAPEQQSSSDGSATDDGAFELDLDVDSSFDLSDGDLGDFQITGPQVGPPETAEPAAAGAEPIAPPAEPSPLASPALSQQESTATEPRASDEESDLLLPAEEFSAGMLQEPSQAGTPSQAGAPSQAGTPRPADADWFDAPPAEDDSLLALHEMDLSMDLELPEPESASATPQPTPSPAAGETSPAQPAADASNASIEAHEIAQGAPSAPVEYAASEPAPLQVTPVESASFDPAPCEPVATPEPPPAAFQPQEPAFHELAESAASEATPVTASPIAEQATEPGDASAPVADSSGMPMIPDDIQKVNDLLAEAEVFVKYGLQEKAVDRLSEVLRLDPRHLGAATQLIRLQLERGQHMQVAPLFNGLYQEVEETGALELWDELKESLNEHGYVVENDQIVALPGGVGLDGEPLAGADIDVGDIFGEPAAITDEAVDGSPPHGVAAPIPETAPVLETAPALEPPATPEPTPEVAPVADAPTVGGGGLVDLGELGSEIDAEILAEFEGSGAAEQAETVAPADGPMPEVLAAEQSIEDAIGELDSANLVEGQSQGGSEGLQPGLAWLNEPGGAVGELKTAVPQETEVLFEDEEQFFDLAAELQSEMAPEAATETPVSPEEQSLEEIVEGFKKGVSENLSSEDYDTHYNLGIAYREMMLLDEAIGEFQIAAKSDQYLVDCCAMLGLCFREKGLPDLAMKWYQRALESASITEDQTLGMLYEMGSVHLERQERDEAYRTFVEIYGMNTNYRDVASKMAELAPAEA